ncbi:MAG: DNA-binding protein [Candidatus Omnitrophica bacterium]|nr:DNA-binding protein [Candidatus Omnitrophota bacterium]
MLRNIFIACLFLSAFCLSVQAATVSSVDLREDSPKYDGQTITFQGEVIGDIIVSGEFVWINVKDQTGAVGVFCPKELVEGIEYKGEYRFSGDIISVKGVFHERCPQHGGDTDIHAQKITLIEKGEQIEHPLNPQKIKASIILPSIVFVLAIIHLIVRKFRKP